VLSVDTIYQGGDENHSKDNQLTDLEIGDYVEVGEMARRMNSIGSLAAWSCALLITATVAAEQSADIQIAQTSVGSSKLSWQPAVSFESAVLTVSGPGELSLRREFAAGEALVFRVHDTNQPELEDGQYAWELRFSPVTDHGVKEALRAAREGGDASQIEALKKQGKLPAEPLVVFGYFSVVGGSIVADKAEPSMRRGGGRVEPSGSTGTIDTDSGVPIKDQVILDDLIVDGSACIGQDCVNGESFGFDTIRIKENNLRIRAVDTSSTASFPSRDWQITFNDSANGGANKFSIDDIDGGRTPFTIEAGAPSHSVYVDDGGRLGFGTSTPVVDLHLKTGNTPTLRLEQDGSSGFTPQTWDVAGNEANFFIRDATNGSTLPFRIRPGAPTSTIDIAADGDVGIGTDSPERQLHVKGTDTSRTRIEVTNTNSTAASRTLLKIDNNGPASFAIRNGALANQWTFSVGNSGFTVSEDGSGTQEMRIVGGGNMTIGGTLTEGSSRELKQAVESIDGLEILERVADLPLALWSYRHDNTGVRHLGPMAEDFYSVFGLGRSSKGIASLDTSGVALAAIQGLNQLLDRKDLEIRGLRENNAELAERIERLEVIVAGLTE
jgi:hypothetical protein